MTDAIAKTLTNAATRTMTALKDGAGKSISSLYKDTGDKADDIGKRSLETDMNGKQSFDSIHGKMDVDEPKPTTVKPGGGSHIAKLLDPDGDHEMQDAAHDMQDVDKLGHPGATGSGSANRPKIKIKPDPTDPDTWWKADTSRPGRSDGLVLSGHGGWDQADGYTRVPKGTILHLYTNHGQVIPDDLGGKVETGDASGANFENYKGPGSSRWMKGGQSVTNYTISEPHGLTIQGSPVIARPQPGGGFQITHDPGTPHETTTNIQSLTDPNTKMPVNDVFQHSVTFGGDVKLSDLLTENMGHVHMAACNFVETPGRTDTRNQDDGLFNPPGGTGR